jgi:S-adenosylmethionine-diacylglycerol 3-amino-3-carboxypropyl transferase
MARDRGILCRDFAGFGRIARSNAAVTSTCLLDSQDWMAEDEIRARWNAIDHTGSDHVRVIFRTAGKESPLEGGEHASLRRRDEERSRIGFECDRSGIYGGFHCYVRR